MFWKKKEVNKGVKVIVTKTSTQAQDEDIIINKANKKSEICPVCGFKSDLNVSTYPMEVSGTDVRVIYSHCVKCKTEWRTQYRY